MITDEHISDAKKEFDKALEYLKAEFGKLQTGRASAVLVEDIPVDAYGQTQPLKSLAQINIPEQRSISIRPWDKGLLKDIETAIKQHDQGLNPMNNGEMISINLPQLTEERRKDLVKIVHKLAEDCKITVRQARQTAHQKFKDMDELTEDDKTGSEKKLQSSVDDANGSIEEMVKKKEGEVMTV